MRLSISTRFCRGIVALAGLALLIAACGGSGGGGDPLTCERDAAESLGACVDEMNDALRDCYLDSGRTCDGSVAAVDAALATLAQNVRAACGDAGVQALGYGPLLTRDGFVERLRVACQSESQSLASRTFGGPHGAAWAAADATERTCLE